MSRTTFKNISELVFQPTVSEGIQKDLMGSEKKSTALAAETAVTLDFNEFGFHDLTLGTANITLNATVFDLKPGESIYLKVTQDATAARTITWGSNILTSVTITASTSAVDLLMGVFDGTNLIIGAIAQDIS
jgi:hypothetical protein